MQPDAVTVLDPAWTVSNLSFDSLEESGFCERISVFGLEAWFFPDLSFRFIKLC